MKWFYRFAFIAIIGAIFISSFYFTDQKKVKPETKQLIYELVEHYRSELLSDEDNDELKHFFQSFTKHRLPHPIADEVTIPYYDEYSDPTYNENYMQYISVQYQQVEEAITDTTIYFEYISYATNNNIDDVYFGKIVIRSFDGDRPLHKLKLVVPMELQK